MWSLQNCILLGLLILFTPVDCQKLKQVDCTANGTQTECPSACPETCEYYGQGLCYRICGAPCVCKPGYVINAKIPACVLLSDCPKGVVRQPNRKPNQVIDNFKCFSMNKDCLKPQ